MADLSKKKTASLKACDEVYDKMDSILNEYPYTNLGTVISDDLHHNNGALVTKAFCNYDNRRKAKAKDDGKNWYKKNKQSIQDKNILRRIELTHGKTFIIDNIGT